MVTQNTLRKHEEKLYLVKYLKFATAVDKRRGQINLKIHSTGVNLYSKVPSNISTMITIFGSKSNFATFFPRRKFCRFPVGFAKFMIRSVHKTFSQRVQGKLPKPTYSYVQEVLTHFIILYSCYVLVARGSRKKSYFVNGPTTKALA